MTNYTAPIRATFEFQRRSIEQGQRAVEQSIDFQRNVSNAVVDGIESTEAAQRRAAEFSRTATHQTLDAIETNVPGTEAMVAEIRETVDEQYDLLLENHAEAFERLATEYSEGTEAYDDMTADYLEALDEQIDLLVDAHEEVESQSLEAVEQAADGVEELQAQFEELGEQAREMSEQVAEA